MKSIIPFLIVLLTVVSCKSEKKKDLKSTFNIDAVKSCDDVLNLCDKGLKVYEGAYVKYLNALDAYQKENPNINIIDNEGKIPEGYKKIMQELENQVSDFNSVTKDENISNLYKKCIEDKDFTKKVDDKIFELQTKLKQKTPKEFHILIDLSLEEHIKQAMF